jgi:hypothetical protein
LSSEVLLGYGQGCSTEAAAQFERKRVRKNTRHVGAYQRALHRLACHLVNHPSKEPRPMLGAYFAEEIIMVATANRKSAPCGQKTVMLRRLDNHLCVDPATPEAVDSLLATTHSAPPVPGSFLKARPNPRLLGEVCAMLGNELLCTSAGLEPVVRTALAKAGYEVKLFGTPLGELPAPDLTYIQHTNQVNRSVIEFVRARPRGIIRTGYAVDPLRLIAQVAVAWPNLKIAVAVSTRDEATKVGAALGKLLGEVTVITGGNCPSKVCRVVVITYDGLTAMPIYFEDAKGKFYLNSLEMMFVLDAHVAVNRVHAISGALRARLYGFPSSFNVISALDRDNQARLFGFAELLIQEEGYRQRQVKVLRYPIKGGIDLIGLSGVALKRQGIWHNELRNRKIARLARELITDPKALAKMLQLPDTDAMLTERARGNILVVVENVEHALALHAKLTEFFICHGPEDSTDGLSKEQMQLLNRLPNPFSLPPIGFIVTTTALRDLDLRCADVLIRADAGSDLPSISIDALKERDNNPAKPLLVIDCHDKQHPAIRRLSRLRQQAYQRRGWLAPYADAEQARVDAFLASRPRRPSR